MSVRTAELLMAIVLALCSIGLMYKSTELSITWVKGQGPGGGAWPFWLSAGMLICCLLTIVRWFRRVTPESQNEEVFMSREAVNIVGLTALSLIGLVGLTEIIGIYFAIALFLLFYLRFMGRHNWVLVIILSIGVPIFIFCFFEWALTIELPKAYSEPLFYPIYNLMY